MSQSPLRGLPATFQVWWPRCFLVKHEVQTSCLVYVFPVRIEPFVSEEEEVGAKTEERGEKTERSPMRCKCQGILGLNQ